MAVLETGPEGLIDVVAYPVPHTPVAGQASTLLLDTSYAIQWMDERFAGTIFETNCPGDHTDAVPSTGLNAVEIAGTGIGVIAGVLVLDSLAG